MAKCKHLKLKKYSGINILAIHSKLMNKVKLLLSNILKKNMEPKLKIKNSPYFYHK